MKQTQIDKIKRYYDSTVIDYKLLWMGSKDLAMHFGYYADGVENHSESLIKINAVLARYANITPKDMVLDAGCGYGGSSIWLAKNINCNVVGLNIVPYQIKKAKESAEVLNVADKVDFRNEDYSNTSFPNGYFDVVWGLESIVHADNKERFVREAFRLMKKKGRLIIAEYLLRNSPPLSNNEKALLKPWLLGWAMPSLLTPDEYKSIFEKIGFRNIEFFDITKNVLPSLNRLSKLNILYPFAEILNKLKIISNDHFGNIQGSLAQIKTLRKGLWRYTIITAKKF